MNATALVMVCFGLSVVLLPVLLLAYFVCAQLPTSMPPPPTTKATDSKTAPAKAAAPALPADLWDFSESNLPPTAVIKGGKSTYVPRAGAAPAYTALAPGAYAELHMKTVSAADAVTSAGGVHINAYTLFIDFKLPQKVQKWMAVYQTSPTNMNDAEAYLNSDGGIGV
jgi:hypothetical protein